MAKSASRTGLNCRGIFWGVSLFGAETRRMPLSGVCPKETVREKTSYCCCCTGPANRYSSLVPPLFTAVLLLLYMIFFSLCSLKLLCCERSGCRTKCSSSIYTTCTTAGVPQVFYILSLVRVPTARRRADEGNRILVTASPNAPNMPVGALLPREAAAS